jgi:A/G-specific adenine glycosylase
MQDPYKVSKKKILQLRKAVLNWFSAYGRDFPWRHTNNPYHLIIAEVFLRQTQAERVVQPYLDLIGMYPDLQTLANASVDELRLWFQPLGLFTRADHLIETAKIIISKHKGTVPNDLNDLQALPGLGIYSARAVLCLGFGIPFPMVDEGSGRVLRRILGLTSNRPAYSDHRLLQIASEILPIDSSIQFNLGLLDIAAICCHIRNPDCSECPLEKFCSYSAFSGEIAQ